MNIRSKNKVSVSFSMSGMTDIVFLLLIFFMLTSTLIAPNALKLLLPQAGVTAESDTRVQEIVLSSDGRIRVDGRTIVFEQLEAVITVGVAGQIDPAVRLITLPGVSVKETVKVMNVAAKLGVQVVLTKQN